MKILVAKFQLEANEHVDMKCDLPNVALSYGRAICRWATYSMT